MFTQFVDNLKSIVTDGQDESVVLKSVSEELQQILGKPDWLPASHTKPRDDRYAQYPLYVDPQGRFSVVSFVWKPGQWTPVHDHTVWGVVGIHQGVERTEAYREVDGKLQKTKTIDANVGEVGAVSPAIGDVHRVGNVSEDVAISIHVYGGNIGTVKRHVFDDQTMEPSEFVSGYEDVAPLVA
jgi:predicted metal-dependent enzyme (double-stranded beta helix superfamily)